MALPRAAGAAQGVSSQSSESPAIREALARQLQGPGPITGTQGQSGASGDAAAPSGKALPALATADSNTWQLPDGPRVTRLYETPVNFKESNGGWHAIEDQLVASPLGGYENAANSFSLKLPDTLQSSVSLTTEGHTVSFSLQHAATSSPAVSGATATYANVLPGTSLAYTSESSGVREVATLTGSEAPEQLRYMLSVPSGLNARSTPDGSIVLTDSQGQTWFTIPAPVAYRPDAGPASGRPLTMSISSAEGSTVVTVDTSAGWLREMLASGPVAIDPSVTVSASQACTLNAEAVKTSSCSAATLQEGYDSTHQERHALLEFSMSSLPQAALVLNAKLGLYVEAKSTSNTKAVGVYRVTKPWTTGATWESYDGTHAWTTGGGDYNNPSENSDGVVNSSVGGSTGWYYWYPTKMVQEWANTANAPEQERENSEGKPEKVKEGANNEGLIVKDQTDNSTQNLLTIASPTAASNKPYLEVTYDLRGQGSSPQYTQLSTALTDSLQMSVNVGSGDLLLANRAMQIAGVNGVNYESTLYFNSLDANVHDVGRWRESMATELTEEPNGDIYTGNGTGQHYVFIKKATGEYLTPPGINATMCVPASEGKGSCKKLPSGVSYRLLYEDPSEDYVDFKSSGWPVHVGDRYESQMTANYSEGVEEPTSWTDTRGRTIKGKVSANGYYTEIKDEAGSRSAKFELESESESYTQLLSTTDPAGKTTKYHYEFGNLDKITDPDGNVTKLVYNSSGTIKEVIRAYGNAEREAKTKFEYDEVGKAPSPCAPTDKATIVKDPDWNEVKPTEHETIYCVNVLDEVDQTVDAEKHATAYVYNPFGEQTATTAAAPGSEGTGGVVSLNYDRAGVNLTCAISGTTEPTTSCARPTETKEKLYTNYSYNGTANKWGPTQLKDPQGNSIFPCYAGEKRGKAGEEEACEPASAGPEGRVRIETDQLEAEKQLKFTWNTEGMKKGTIATSTDAKEHTTEYKYDEKGNLTEIKPPAGSGVEKTTIKVDADSRPEVITDGAGHKETITYDKDGRITKIVYSGTGTEKTVTIEYDGDGNIIKREDNTGTTKYTIDALNRLTKEELPGTITHSYTYDAASNMTSFEDDGGKTKYNYNGLNELASMEEPKEIGTDKFTYDNDHRLTKIEYPSGLTESYELQPATGRVLKIAPSSGIGAQTLTYTYLKGKNNQEQIQTVAESPAGATTSYAYDPLNRLKEAATSGAHQTRYFFKLDGDGNRLAQQVNLSEKEGGEKEGTWTYYDYNSGNELECRLTTESACTEKSETELSKYKYDKAGEETEIIAKGDPSGTTFAYNAASELNTLTPGVESGLSLTYGGTGQDDLVTKGSSTTIENSLLGISRETVSGNANCFERTPEGLLIDIRTPTGDYNPLYDAQGDIVGLVNSSKELKRTFRYGPYGDNIKATGKETEGPFIFGYKGGYRMPGGNKGSGSEALANGLWHFGERYYDPTTGRWTQEDPLGGGYNFVGDDPLDGSDPTGEGGFKGSLCKPETTSYSSCRARKEAATNALHQEEQEIWDAIRGAHELYEKGKEIKQQEKHINPACVYLKHGDSEGC